MKFNIPPAGRSLLIWLATHVFAMTIYFIGAFAITDHSPIYVDSNYTFLFIILFVGLLFSSPVIVFLIPLVYSLTEIESRIRRLLYGGLSILVLCALVVYAFCVLYGLSSPEIPSIIIFLLPYVIGAELSLLIMLWSVKNYEREKSEY